MAKRASSQPDNETTGAAPDAPFEGATTDAAGTITEPLPLPAAAPETEAAKSERAPVKTRELPPGRVHRVSLREARTLKR